MMSVGCGSPGAHLHQGWGAGDEIKKILPSGHKIYTEVTPWAEVVSPIQGPSLRQRPAFVVLSLGSRERLCWSLWSEKRELLSRLPPKDNCSAQTLCLRRSRITWILIRRKIKWIIITKTHRFAAAQDLWRSDLSYSVLWPRSITCAAEELGNPHLFQMLCWCLGISSCQTKSKQNWQQNRGADGAQFSPVLILGSDPPVQPSSPFLLYGLVLGRSSIEVLAFRIFFFWEFHLQTGIYV